MSVLSSQVYLDWVVGLSTGKTAHSIFVLSTIHNEFEVMYPPELQNNQ